MTAKVQPTPFGPERAKAIYAQRGPFFDFRRTDMTPGENAYVQSLPGDSWASAFFEIMNGDGSVEDDRG